MAETIVGLDIGSSSLKAAQGREVSDGVEVERLGAKALEPGTVKDGKVEDGQIEDLSDAIEELWDESGFTTKDVILGISGDRVLTTEVVVPYMKQDDLDESLLHQIEQHHWLPLDPEKSEIDRVVLEDFVDPEDDKRKLRLFLVGCPSQVIEDAVAAAVDVGLNPRGADLGALAALRSLRVVNRPLSDSTLDCIIDVGGDLTTVTFHQGGVPLNIQTAANAAGNTATATIRKRVVDDFKEAERAKIVGGTGDIARVIDATADAIARNIRSIVDFYFSERESLFLGSITLIGGSSLLQGLQTSLQREFNSIPVIQGEFDHSFRMAGGSPLLTRHELGGTFFTAAGLITGTVV